MKKVNLPSAFSLVGTKALPLIDNQGGIGSCASQSITRNQFSNAVTRYAHSVYPNCTRSSHNPDECFAPKFSYNLSGAGTIWVYEIVKDHGAIPVSEFPFEKNESGGHIKQKDGKWIQKSAESPVMYPGMMKKALKNRIKSYERVWFDGEPFNTQLTTNEAGLELLDKIKEAVVLGNPVITGGYPARWIYAKIVNTGVYGKVGDQAIVSASGSAGGGHQVTIVGYDDDVTCEFAGAKMKGAFIVANSYGETWVNEGYTYIMYDAINLVSEHEVLNDTKLYSGQMYITPSANLTMYSEFLAKGPQTLVFEPIGEKTVEGVSLTAYNIKDKESGKYLAYSEVTQDRKIKLVDEASSLTEWCPIPYEKLSEVFPSFIKDEYKKEYEGSYWVYATGRTCNPEGNRFLDAGVSFNASGRELNLAGFNSGKYPVAKSWDILGMTEGTFEGKLGIVAGKDQQNSRNWTFDQFGFMYWDRDVVLGLPELYIEFELDAKNRDGFEITLTRTDKDGNVDEYVPAMFRYRKHHPEYHDKGEYNTFSGKINGEAETGYFALSYSELLKFPAGKTALDYKWGFTVSVDSGESVTVRKPVLYYGGSETPLGTAKSKTVSRKAKFEF